MYIDHGFFIRRKGIPILKRHFELWKTSVPDFVMEVESKLPATSKDGKRFCSFRTINKGTFLNDLVVKKASGEKFLFRGAVDLIIDEETGLIETLNEWYSWKFENSTDVSGYHTLDSTIS